MKAPASTIIVTLVVTVRARKLLDFKKTVKKSITLKR